MLVFCIDLRSFYASVECSLMNLDPFTTPLVVADTSRGKGSIVLAVTPFLKSIGVPSRCRIFELPQNQQIIFAKPRMAKYIEYSKIIYKVFLKYLSKDDIHVYSIDESFLDFTNYPMYRKYTPQQLAKIILDDIYETTKITATCGIGENMFLSKIALDIFAKKSTSGIAILTTSSFKELVWPLKVTGMWGIGHRIEKRLNNMNLYTFQDIANSDKSLLKEEFGVIGVEIFEHSWGIDNSSVSEIRNYKTTSKSISTGQVLYEDYNKEDLKIVLFEMVDEISLKLVDKNLECRTISLSIGYSYYEKDPGFTRAKTLLNSTSSAKILFKEFESLYIEHTKDLKIRTIRIRVTNIECAILHQSDLFENTDELEKEKKLYKTANEIKKKFGKNAISKASSLKKEATQIKRNKLIGGHNAE